MSDHYPFTGERAFAHNGAMVWNDQVAVESSIDFSQVSDSTLTDSINDSYETAVEDNETTQYLSVLETTNDITLDDLHHITLENSKMSVGQENVQFGHANSAENEEVCETNEQQVIVFSVDGSDDLYGIQFAQDEEGNMQKYQFKFRTTEDGQLEAIPESVQLLPGDTETHEKEPEGEVLDQEAVDNEEADVMETQIVYQEDSNVQETHVYEEQGEQEQHVEEEECGPSQMIIKGELEAEEEAGGDEANSDTPSRDEEAREEEEEQYVGNEAGAHSDNNFEDDNIDVKTGIIEETSSPGNIKEEMYQEESEDSAGGRPLKGQSYEMYNHPQVDIKPMPYEDGDNDGEEPLDSEEDVERIEVNNEEDVYDQTEDVQETVLEYEQYTPEEVQHVYDETDTSDGHALQGQEVVRGVPFDQVFIKEDVFHSLQKVEQVQREEEEEGGQETYYTEVGTENDSDNEDYQIVEGLHVTAEGDIDEDSSCQPCHESDTILQEVSRKSPAVAERVNILKQPSLIKTIKESKAKNSKTFVYYVVPHLEKENVNSLSVNYTTSVAAGYKSVRSNPRSILKSSFPEIKEEAEAKVVADERFNKRFARSKEAVQARLFNNFISKTTIAHAPIRQTRLPRKQQIKPVDNRRDEEIIVQEVMVGSNGFIENVEEKLKNKDKLEVTQYVILSDSDEDYDPKKGNNKKKKKHKKHTKGDMDEQEDSDVSVIEIPSGDEEVKCEQQENPKRGRGRPKKSTDIISVSTDSLKRRRGRPPKSADLEESPQKKSRTDLDEVESDTAKKEFKCPHCPKTFPSQNSLSTHIHHHNLENSLRNNQTNKAGTTTATVEYRHKCETCLGTFKNSILLRRHLCPKQTQKVQSKRLDCAVCKKSFPDLASLNVHKRSHVKENLVSTTAVAKVSPKKVKTRPSVSKPRSPRKGSTSKSPFKCKDCSRVCFSQESLDLHEKTHRKFPCPSCGASFSSRLLLDTHVRVKCVKPLSSPHGNRRLSYKIRKSFVQSPRRRSGRFAKRSLAPPAGPNSSVVVPSSKDGLGLNLRCDHCGETFTLFQEYFKHQVKMHGLETPDKSVLMEEKKRLHKPKSLHGGIPTRDGMKKVFADIRSKMALITPKKDTN